MANYLLLRNNKESGPHSLDDLMELGLKPYDLVWVQGKSAAWRYPSEIEELKPFAPQVEEQPFDRFYKKQTEEHKQEPLVKQEAQIAPEHEKYIPKKSVFVTMPGGQKTAVVKPAFKKEEPVKEDTYKPAPTPVQQTISVTENPVAAQVKYSQPLDEIKEMYVKTLYDRKQKIARKGFWLQSLKKAAVILSLVAVGLIAGFIIKSNGSAKKEIVKDNTASQTSKATIDPQANVLAADTVQQQSKIIQPPSGGFVNAPSQRAEELAEPRPLSRNSQPDNTKPDNVKKEATPPLTKNDPGVAAISPGVDMDPATGERSRKVRSETTKGTASTSSSAEVKSFHGNDHLSGMVTVTSNEYKKVAFGGIRNLELTVANDSKYTLDKVLVELQYLKPSEQPLKTENIEFKSIGPKATSTLRIPDTNRGIKVVYKIINIKSREMDELASGN